jgi:hypothetical protein
MPFAATTRRMARIRHPSLRFTHYYEIHSVHLSLGPWLFIEASIGYGSWRPYIRIYVNKTFGQFPRTRRRGM